MNGHTPFFQEIKKQLQSQNKNIIAKQVGYHSIKKFEKAYATFISYHSSYDWIESSFYDFVCTAKDFFKNIALALGYSIDEINKELEQAEKYKQEIEKFKESYIFVDTNFKRGNEPVFALVFCEHKRKISLYKKENLLFKSTKEILEILSQEIQQHYLKNSQGILMWGVIVSYKVYLFDEIYLFDTKGVLQGQKDVLKIQ